MSKFIRGALVGMVIVMAILFMVEMDNKELDLSESIALPLAIIVLSGVAVYYDSKEESD